MKWWLSCLALAGLLVGCQPPDTPPAPSGPTLSKFIAGHENSAFGVNTHYLSGDSSTFDIAVKRMADAGILWDRDSFYYSIIEPTKGQFNWQPFDDMVNQDLKAGVNILGLLCYGAAWWNTDDKMMTPLTDSMLADWSDYVKAVVSRYKDSVHYWEIWNEENTAFFWKASPNASDYTRLLKASADVIRSIAPDSKIVLGGLVGLGQNFLQQVYDAGGAQYFDIIAAHPYTPKPDWSIMTVPMTYPYPSLLVKNISLLNAQFPDKPVWITELGWSTLPAFTAMNEEMKAYYLVRAWVQLLALPYVQKLFWYDFQNDLPSNIIGADTMGLVNRDAALSPKPSYYAYQTLIKLLGGATFQKQVRGPNIDSGNGLSDDVFEYRFTKGTSTIAVIWDSSGLDISDCCGADTRTITMTDITASTATLITVTGDSQTVSVSGGQYTATVSQEPIYLEFSSGS